MRNEIKLTNDIELVLKSNIPNLSRTLKPHEENGEKFIMVRSDEGYKYAENLEISERQ